MSAAPTKPVREMDRVTVSDRAEELFPVVLCVTDGTGRMTNLIEATAEAGAAPGRYWFTTRDQLANVWGSIWSGPGEQTGLSLLSTLG